MHVREPMTEGMKEGHQPANKPGNLDSFFHSLGVKKRSFNEVEENFKIPLVMILG